MAQSFLSLPSRSWFLQCLSPPSMKLYSPGLVHCYGQANVTKVFCSWKTKRTLFSNYISYSPRFKSLCRVKSSEDFGQKMSYDGMLFDEQTLEENLQTAIEEENYAQAAKIRDNLRSLHEDGKASVLAANARFYNSFRKGSEANKPFVFILQKKLGSSGLKLLAFSGQNIRSGQLLSPSTQPNASSQAESLRTATKQGDLATMQTLWSKGENVCVVHPGVSGISGYDLVMGSWDLVWAEYDFPLEINVKDAQVHVRGDFGYVTCIEMVKTKGSSWGKQFVTNIF